MSRNSERVNFAVCAGIALLILLPVGRAEGASDNEPNLLKLALKKFGKLNEAEKMLFRNVVNGWVADCSDKSGENNDPNEAKDRDENTRVIRAECIFWLCTDGKASAMVTHKGIRVKGARIEGELDFSDARISFPLSFRRCAFKRGINLRNAEIRNLNLEGTYTGPICGSGLIVKGNVFLRDGFTAEGKVDLKGARIEGNLGCDEGRFIYPNGRALNGSRLNIEGNVYLNNGFKAEGEVNMLDSTIGGNLDCSGGQFINENKKARALYAYGANIKGDVLLRNGFKAEGKVYLCGATVGGNLDCEDGNFINPNGYALYAYGVNVAGDVYLRNKFRAEGEVYLMGATIGRDLDCNGGKFIDPCALSADSIDVKGNIFLQNDFHADGKVSLIGATIGGSFKWREVHSPKDVTLDLRYASVGTLNDDAKSWPEEGKLFLHGLEYKDIAPMDANSRIDWLRRQPGFSPQPYEQLAAVLRKGGQDEDAKKILIWKNEDKAGLTNLTTWSEKIWYRVLGPMIDYGYRPLKALWGVLVFVVSGWVLFGIGYCRGLVTPQSESAYIKQNNGTAEGGTEARQLSDVYPRFNVIVYSFDTFVPLIDLHQAKYWLPNAKRGPKLLRIKGFSLHIGGLLRLYLWIHLTMGWLLSMLLVVGLTGLVRT